MEPIWVDAPGGRYPIWVGYDLLQRIDHWQSLVHSKNVFVITHPEIASHYLTPLLTTCQKAGSARIEHMLVQSGDQHKTLASAMTVWSSLLEHHYHRDAVLIALGGGMIGDLCGFSAACYMRGIDFIQCPTSLLAQIDAAIGGKTAVNHPMGKNMIGVFHQPKAVFADLGTLTSLSQREYVAGLAELIKYGMSLDAALFRYLEQNWQAVLERQPKVLLPSVSWGCRLKAEVVSADEKEQGKRIVLNFGHTTAHAIESLLNYEGMLHGEAVALGMLVATHLSIQQKTLDPDILERLRTLLKVAGLPTKFPSGISVLEILAKMKHDKKHAKQQLRWVLLRALGEARISTDVSAEQIDEALKTFGVK